MSDFSALQLREEDVQENRVGTGVGHSDPFPSFRPSATFNPYLMNDASPFLEYQPTLSQLTSFVYQLSATVGSLSHENSLLSDAVRNLVSDNESLQRQVEQNNLVIMEISRASLPGGHWVWEAGYRGEERIGRWVWSGNKYKQIPFQHTDGLPTASLDSMPVELFNSIASLLPRSAILSLCGVSVRLFQLASQILYPKSGVLLGTKEAALFVNARTSAAASNHIRARLLPSTIKLYAADFTWKHLSPCLNKAGSNSPPLRTIPVNLLRIHPGGQPSSLFQWSPILNHLNPKELVYGDGHIGDCVLPTILQVEQSSR
ncbi:hypothetical protein BDY24DRAFT_437991 [Mrakia frigida]|uniref:uncharacterized protein n=1 Tax=Mrakia frigida TaxID=29902 RepID=UPI003FCC1DE0